MRELEFELQILIWKQSVITGDQSELGIVRGGEQCPLLDIDHGEGWDMLVDLADWLDGRQSSMQLILHRESA